MLFQSIFLKRTAPVEASASNLRSRRFSSDANFPTIYSAPWMLPMPPEARPERRNKFSDVLEILSIDIEFYIFLRLAPMARVNQNFMK